MISTLLKPWFEIEVFWKFNKTDFTPIPNIDVVMIKIKRRNKPLLQYTSSLKYRDFIIYSYNRNKGFAKLEFGRILELFREYQRNADFRKKNLVANAVRKILKDQGKLEKIHRTRKDKNWRNCRL